MKSIAILGCGGFIGSHLVEYILSNRDWHCVGVDINDTKLAHLNKSDRFQFIKGNIYNGIDLKRIISGADTVVSLAAICNPFFYNRKAISVIESNYENPVKVVRECAKQGKRLIHFSTSEVYGKTPAALGFKINDSEQILDEESTHLILGPISMERWSYACAKQLLERTIYAYGREENLNYTIIRPFNFIGQRMDYIHGVDGEGIPRVMACFMESLMFNRPLMVVNGGNNKRVFTYIDDAVDAVVRIIEQGDKTSGKILNIGNPINECSIAELAKLMIEIYPEVSNKIAGDNCKIKDVSATEFYGEGYDDSDRRIPNIDMATKLLDWKPQTNLKDTIKKTMRGFIEYYGAHLILLLILFATSTTPAKIEDIVYGKIGTLELSATLVTPENSTKQSPIVILLHEGGFRRGSKECFTDIAQELLEKDIASMSVQYRLVQEGGAYPEAVKDCLEAVYWLMHNGHKHRIDTSRIAIWGSSAGAYLGVMVSLAACLPKDIRRGHGEFKFSRPKITAVISSLGFYDWEKARFKGDGFIRTNEHYKEASPLNLTDCVSCNYLIIAADKDEFFNVEEAEEFTRRISANGKRAELQIKRQQSHAGICDGSSSFAKWAVPLSIVFLEKELREINHK